MSNHTTPEDSCSPTHHRVLSSKKKSSTLQSSDASSISIMGTGKKLSGSSHNLTSTSLTTLPSASTSSSSSGGGGVGGGAIGPASIMPKSSSGAQGGFATLRPHTLLSRQQEDHALQNELRDQMNVYKRMRTQHQKQVCVVWREVSPCVAGCGVPHGMNVCRHLYSTLCVVTCTVLCVLSLVQYSVCCHLYSTLCVVTCTVLCVVTCTVLCVLSLVQYSVCYVYDVYILCS